MKNYFSSNNNALYSTHSRFENILLQSKHLDQNDDKMSYSSFTDCQTLNLIRSIVDELYQMHNEEIFTKNESEEKRVRFTLAEDMNRMKSMIFNDSKLIETTIKHQSMLSESPTVVCCLIKGRSKVDCSVSTNDYSSLRCECATQTMDMTILPEYNHSLTSLLSDSRVTLSTPSISTKSTILCHSLSISNHSLYSCDNNNITSSLDKACQFLVPSEATFYDICQEQTLQNYSMSIGDSMKSSNLFEETAKWNDEHLSLESTEKSSDDNLTGIDVKVCRGSKRKLSETHLLTNQFYSTDQDRLLEELHRLNQSLQSMSNDGLTYIHNLLFIFLRNPPQFYQILVKDYHLSKSQANLYVKVMQQWWEKYQDESTGINVTSDPDWSQ